MAKFQAWKSGEATTPAVSGTNNQYRVEPMDGERVFFRLRATINGKRVYGGHIGRWEKVVELFPDLAKKYKPRKKVTSGK